ncbi:MAG: GSCFA domain-containing protein [Flavobacteriaceae bacterium]
MNLQTQIPFSPQEPQIDYHSKIVLLGSCFTEHIGEKLEYFKFQNIQNPFGVIFNPVSIEKLILRALNDTFFTEEDIFQHNEVWYCFEVHSSLSELNKETFLNRLNVSLKTFKDQLLSASHIVITLGSAWVYWHNETNELVANCHKIPQQEFRKELLSAATISKSLQHIVSEVQKVNPKVSFIFTVSPVRHLKDGFEENTLSKAHLISAIHDFLNYQSSIFNLKSAYFPSYEMMMDELRDYRFYEKDMLHPNETAIDYIWDKFKKVWVDHNTEVLQKEIDIVQKGLLHKPFHPESDAYLKFKAQLHSKMESVKKRLPYVTF